MPKQAQKYFVITMDSINIPVVILDDYLTFSFHFQVDAERAYHHHVADILDKLHDEVLPFYLHSIAFFAVFLKHGVFV